MKDIRDVFFERIHEHAKENKNIIFLTADMGAYALEAFRKELPDQFINVGAAEQNMIGVACGLALSGKRPICYAIAAFLVYRAFEFIKLDVCDANLPIILVGAGPGLTYRGDGHTHHAIYDVSIVSLVPNLTIFTPHTPEEAAEAADLALENQSPTYVRLYSANAPEKWGEYVDRYFRVPFILHSNGI